MFRYVLGIGIILVGVTLLLNNFGATNIDVGWVIRTFWPLILIFWGLNKVVEPYTGRVREQDTKVHFSLGEIIIGAILMVLGILLLLKNLGLLESDLAFLWNLFWPIIFIIIGINLLKGKRNPNGKNHLSVMGGIEVGKQSSWELKSESYTAFMGGVELDLTRANIPEGEIILDLTAVMGGIEVTIPKELPVICEGSAILGGVEFLGEGSGGIVSNKTMSSNVSEESRTLVRIQSRAVMGGIEVKRFG